MSEQNSYLVAPYSALASIYDRAGLSAFAQAMIPRYLSYAMSLDWAGRRIIDLGCGTGVTSWWLSQQGYRVLGVDSSASMLAQAQFEVSGELRAEAPEFEQMDLRQFTSPIGQVDMIVAAGGVMNIFTSLRELENVFTRISQSLFPGRLFIFDMLTIRGLAALDGDSVVDGGDFVLYTSQHFSFETLSTAQHFMIWQQAGGGWQRQDEMHIKRGFPIQGVKAMLERTGFDLSTILNPDLQPAVQDDVERVVFVAQKH
jgi:SAM-dependent methyltransferase